MQIPIMNGKNGRTKYERDFVAVVEIVFLSALHSPLYVI